MADSLREWFKEFRQRLKENSCENLVWLINFLPTLVGFPLLSKTFEVSFWLIHLFLLFYVYIVGTVVYQMYFARDFIDSIKSFFNISVFILVFNNSLWWIIKRKDLNDLLILVYKNDDLLRDAGSCLDKHEKLLKKIKIIIILCYMFHFVNDVLIFTPSRIIDMDNFSITSCVGLEPLTSSPKRVFCMGILALQQLGTIVAVASYDITLLFLFSHTTAIFQILYEDMTSFDEIADRHEHSEKDYSILRDRLKNLTLRHAQALHTVKKLKKIYSAAIGISFGIDAISLCIFFVLPLDVCLNFAPLISHGLFIFFLYCYQGQRLTTASEKFEMSVYCCGWEKLRVRERCHVLLMLKQSQKPVIVHAARIIPICMHTFAQTMQTVYKFVTVFRI